MELFVGGKLRNIEIENKRIRNLYLRVKEDGSLLVSAPRYVSNAEILSFIKEKDHWIKKTDETQRKNKEASMKRLGDAIVYVFGEKKYAKYELGKKNIAYLDEDIITFYLKEINDENIALAFNKLAKPLLNNVIDIIRPKWDNVAQVEGRDEFPIIAFKDLKSKWGSCEYRTGRILLSIKLIHYPISVIEAVLWHEYAHLIIPNHSKEYYQLVNKWMPDYDDLQKLLK